MLVDIIFYISAAIIVVFFIRYVYWTVISDNKAEKPDFLKRKDREK